MRQSTLFTKTRKEAPKDEVAKNAELLIRAGYIHKEMAGVYSYLPLGLRVLAKIENIIREEMNVIGGQEIRMATLHPSENWKKTGGWDKIDVLFKLQSRTDKEYALGQSEEEIVTPIAQEYVTSYKDLPLAVYQIGQKYRDELRAKSGIMRGREFGMKDMYSFHVDQGDFDRFYEIVKQAYFQIFKRCGLTGKVTEAAGGSFSEKLSYEFMVLTDAGEDTIVYCPECTHCANSEISKVSEGGICPKCEQGKLAKAKAAEVGNVFDLGQKYPKSFDFSYKDKEGSEKMPVVGCYGIGTTRLMGTIVEVFSDEKGIVWPQSVAPFQVHLISLAMEDGDVKNAADALYKKLMDKGVEVLYDDRTTRAGEKFADSDLLGIPWRFIISEKTLKAAGIEVKNRKEPSSEILSESEAMKILER
ncbi:MAG: Prolyl-tRNA synthetase [Candidatus Magasanikbacteria bacterium GW2011_GWA2_46_17]|uniref:Proline--tRNA ligase n=1 Tax=Candidatus Magasanikbacteria bacterium GW2011_GWA2_46_17 TaxID=1619042 RepID=A0A0G1P0R5_9BACT|nr:MAG: Prolyl-tRNA synthetase [Candidatus Magasanikbacteria bacterium GW2011_GWA2_46_17]